MNTNEFKSVSNIPHEKRRNVPLNTTKRITVRPKNINNIPSFDRAGSNNNIINKNRVSENDTKSYLYDSNLNNKTGENTNSISKENTNNPENIKTQKRPIQKRKKKSTKQLFIGLIIKITVISFAVWAMFTFVLGVSINYGNNMHPSIKDGDLVFSLRLQNPYINAAVMYEYAGTTKTGRVVALEGSVVDIGDNGELKINGIVPSEEVYYPTFTAESSNIKYPYTVEAGKVFILNDFRTDTFDSRTFGAVKISDLKGPILFTMRRRGF